MGSISITSNEGFDFLPENSQLAANPVSIVFREAQNFARAPFKVAAKTGVFDEGDELDRVLVVLDGWFLTYKSFDDGEVQILDFVVPGDVVGPASGDGKTAMFSMEAITDAKIVSVPVKIWDERKKQSPDFLSALVNKSAAKKARIAERMLRLGKGSATVRLAYTLLETCIRLRASGLIAGPDCSFHLPLTQKHLGDFCGLSAVHVCRTLRRMVRHNIIAVSDHIDIRILDVDALADLAKADRELLEQEIIPTID